jgi:hypothetical protein
MKHKYVFKLVKEIPQGERTCVEAKDGIIYVEKDEDLISTATGFLTKGECEVIIRGVLLENQDSIARPLKRVPEPNFRFE